ncbi:hypothetical protein [Microvirga antarctica]|uniref:hypothetical protein n=1 Tax=Microvirga antarctica TaxID=2819233 RepID=UPI001B301F9A|nr:hypothetical protein [Microvirga antarctica]
MMPRRSDAANPRGLTDGEIAEAVRVFWPRFNTCEIARIYAWPECLVANALARLRDGVAV